MALDNIETVCNFSPNICDKGYTLDPISGLCFIVLNSSKNFWSASEACLEIGAELIGFENDDQVKGFLTLFNKGDNSLTKSITIICVIITLLGRFL